MRAAALLACALLAGCGFQLRGSTPLPPALAAVYVNDLTRADAAAPTPLYDALREALRARAIDANDADAASARLNLLRVNNGRRALAAGRAGAVREYRLSYDINYSLSDAGGRPLLPPATLSVTRDVLYDETDVLGAVSGETLTRNALAVDAARALLDELSARLAANR